MSDFMESFRDVARTVADSKLQDELDYLLFRDARDGNEDRLAIVAWFGAHKVPKLEARYQVELMERRANAAVEELQGRLSAAESA